MRRLPKAIFAAVILNALALAGCGSSNTPTAVNVAKVDFKSVAIHATPTSSGSIPLRYTCDGENTSPPVEWGPVPTRTSQMVLFVLGVTEAPITHSETISVEWALAGINPALHHLDAGQIPHGAYPGVTASGKRSYSICPQRGTGERYIFELYGLPRGAVISPSFSGLSILTTLANTSHGTVVNAHGDFTAVYKRV